MNLVKVTHYYQDIEIEWRIHDILSPPQDRRHNCFYVSEPFTFADTTWRLLLVSELSDEPETSRFTFMFIESCKHAVRYNFFLKGPNGSLKPLVAGFMKSKQEECKSHYIKLKQILQERPECVSTNVITILGILRAGCDENMSGESKRKKLRKLDTLSKNFHSLFTDQLSCDIVLHVKDKSYKVHKAVLISRSTVFAAMFQHETSEKQTGIINISDCDPESFQDFLSFLYCGKLQDLTYSRALNLYAIAEKYNVQELKAFCTDHLMVNLEINMWCDLYTMADLYEDKKLLPVAQRFFHKNLLQIFKTPEWETFMKDNHELACKLLKEIPESKIAK